MRIAFDLDDTLIPGIHAFPTERRPRGIRAWLFGKERLRLGTSALLLQLQKSGHEIWVYTTSLRNRLAVGQLFLCHGVRLGGFVNQRIHDRRMAELDADFRGCSKFPPAFSIDILVDDSEGVLQESQRFGFRVLHLRPDEQDWTAKTLDIVAAVTKTPRP